MRLRKQTGLLFPLVFLRQEDPLDRVDGSLHEGVPVLHKQVQPVRLPVP